MYLKIANFTHFQSGISFKFVFKIYQIKNGKLICIFISINIYMYAVLAKISVCHYVNILPEKLIISMKTYFEILFI